MNRLNFSWVIADKLAGCAGPQDMVDLRFLKRKGITLIVRLAEEHKTHVSEDEVLKSGLKDFHEPIGDFTAPPQNQITRIVDHVRKSLEDGDVIAVSCGAGIGRTGMILACILISLNHSVEDALDIAERTRGHRAWETNEQYQAILEYANTKKER